MRLIQRGWDANRVRQTVLWSRGMAFGLAILGAAGARIAPMAALVWISLALGGLAAAAPVAWTVPSLIAPRESVGTLGGDGEFLRADRGDFGAHCYRLHCLRNAFLRGGVRDCNVILLLGIVGYIFLLGRIEPIPEPVENEALGISAWSGSFTVGQTFRRCKRMLLMRFRCRSTALYVAGSWLGALCALSVSWKRTRTQRGRNIFVMWAPTPTTAARESTCYRFDSATGESTSLGLAAESAQPSFLAIVLERTISLRSQRNSQFDGQPTGR